MVEQQKNGRGRPRKPGAVKPGELAEGVCRFTFYTHKTTRSKIKAISKAAQVSEKDTMAYLLRDVGSEVKGEKAGILNKSIIRDLIAIKRDREREALEMIQNKKKLKLIRKKLSVSKSRMESSNLKIQEAVLLRLVGESK